MAITWFIGLFLLFIVASTFLPLKKARHLIAIPTRHALGQISTKHHDQHLTRENPEKSENQTGSLKSVITV
ncbi:hypothetical protein GQ43DRAFT_193069 [Delitschia confertaspora ATCC 74209]|uniref:Uncharacterized protein n=1 Tax=Delitschia confertaspora ATCC 74209 TaxID=1513339 RepID=A0A9P4MV70_9PLEO|nr:hypothetical protein GQ43DRAFT_193069 [Delitschia confertaspora ATCC 74209]